MDTPAGQTQASVHGGGGVLSHSFQAHSASSGQRVVSSHPHTEMAPAKMCPNISQVTTSRAIPGQLFACYSSSFLRGPGSPRCAQDQDRANTFPGPPTPTSPLPLHSQFCTPSTLELWLHLKPSSRPPSKHHEPSGLGSPHEGGVTEQAPLMSGRANSQFCARLKGWGLPK